MERERKLWLITMCFGVILVCLQGFKGVNLSSYFFFLNSFKKVILICYDGKFNGVKTLAVKLWA